MLPLCWHPPQRWLLCLPWLPEQQRMMVRIHITTITMNIALTVNAPKVKNLPRTMGMLKQLT
ncbi:hypothetical protein AA11825_2284 [Acetobacter pomorum DSM 11825]|nr:hypothetical protein AA11825_2284 [Acetobacter pomorum DSM 11825]